MQFDTAIDIDTIAAYLLNDIHTQHCRYQFGYRNRQKLEPKVEQSSVLASNFQVSPKQQSRISLFVIFSFAVGTCLARQYNDSNIIMIVILV